jgi:hypothetical protein
MLRRSRPAPSRRLYADQQITIRVASLRQSCRSVPNPTSRPILRHLTGSLASSLSRGREAVQEPALSDPTERGLHPPMVCRPLSRADAWQHDIFSGPVAMRRRRRHGAQAFPSKARGDAARHRTIRTADHRELQPGSRRRKSRRRQIRLESPGREPSEGPDVPSSSPAPGGCPACRVMTACLRD